MKKSLFITVIVTLFCILLIIPIQRKINSIRETDKLITYSLSEDLPPAIAFVNVGLGAFKGIFSDILWLKAISLQEQGKFFEVGKIAFWITKLNPQFTGASCFMAWNMAYNISIMYAKPADKWKWVENAIKVLRNAAAYNPNSPELYKELSWIYLNKIGDIYDSGNQYYKNQVASEMQSIIGRNPAESFWTSLCSNSIDSEQKEIIAKLKEKFSLDIKYIVELISEFGLLDFRVPQSLAAYWAYRAYLLSPQDRNNYKFLIMSLTSYSYSGKIIYFEPENYSLYTAMPDFDYMKKLDNYFTEEIRQGKAEKCSNLYYTFLLKAARECCYYGNFQLSETLLENSKKYFQDNNFSNFDEYLEKTIYERIYNLSPDDFIREMKEYLRIGIILLNENKDSILGKNLIETWNMFFDKYVSSKPYSNFQSFRNYLEEEQNLLLKAIKQ